MLDIEIDGKKARASEGSTVIEAAERAGVHIPHFCYHKKLSVANNCRMCLVQIEKMPKPLPACATNVSDGMKIFTHSGLVADIQKGILEFLLINHPLDCPVCDQGGECHLQDMAVTYGGARSRYREGKRVVSPKEGGPLISMREMSRCIHCARCVRFGHEIAGIMELGMTGRGGSSEIQTFIGQSIDSELSGNMIDLCPVGALTSKPFRFLARSWELSRRRSVSPHDSFGSNLVLHVKNDRVLRVTPHDNEEINECWLPDKDRFSYEGLASADRLKKPMIRVDGALREVEWNVALDYTAHALRDIVGTHGAEALASLASPHSTLEELYLLQKLTRGLGSGNIDFRPRRRDFSTDGKHSGIPWLGLRIAEITDIDAALVVGSFLRKDHPLFAHRLRQLAKKSGRVSLLSVLEDDPLIDLHARITVRPTGLAGVLASIVRAAARIVNVDGAALPEGIDPFPENEAVRVIAESLVNGKNCAVFLGNAAEQSPQAGLLHALAAELARLASARFGFIGEAANSVGGYVAGALPSGLNAYEMFGQPRRAYILHGIEPGLDCHSPQQALFALKQADMTVVLSPFAGGAFADYADVLLPAAPFSETSGTFVNTEGRIQSFEGACPPLDRTRPAWKIFSALGNMLGLPGFDYDSSARILGEIVPPGSAFVDGLDNSLTGSANLFMETGLFADGVLQRIADVPIYFADPLARRGAALEKTKDSFPPEARMNAKTLERYAISTGDRVYVRQGGGKALLTVRLDSSVPDTCVRVSAAHPVTAGLGDMFGTLEVERV
ncbi:MAG: NADH-quinone oxidoreductase subunit NuoG [Candidatus Accumulibacter sp.]|jgi:NADH-quinone oxidoreductase subunit G|nr:NADH-quinone oxidoreductase subunit NuoG [Accumulibacter sp.]